MGTMQTALEKALPIVATAYGEQFGVNVVLSGTDACTDGKTIVLPLLDNMSELKDVLFGYLAHESSHVRDSNFNVIGKCKSELEKVMLNVIEDIRIERLIQDEFPGTCFTMDAMWNYIVGRAMSPPARPEDNEATQMVQYLLHRLRSKVLKREASTPLAEESQKVVENTFPLGFFIRLDGLLAKYIDGLKCTNDCLKLARAILKAVDDAEKEERKKEQDKQQAKASQDGQGNPDGSSSDGTESSSPSTPGKPDTPQGDKANQEKDDGSTQSGKDTSKNSQKGDQGSSQDTSPNNDSSQSPQDSQRTKDSQRGSSGSLHEKLACESDLPRDSVDQLRGQLKQQAIMDNHRGTSVVIETSSVGAVTHNKDNTSGLQSGILASSAVRSRLLGLLQAQTRENQWLHTRGKRVYGKRLSRVATGDTRVFIQRDHKQATDTAVHVLLDTSGSMNKMQDTANQATVSLALAISSIPKADIAVSIFPGIGGNVSPVVTRGQPIRANLGRFVVRSSGGTPMAEAMLFAAKELASSHRQRKVLIIITDGEPANSGSVSCLNDLIAGHIDTYAIGINSTAVKRYFKNWSVISDVKELQKVLFDIAGQFLDLH